MGFLSSTLLLISWPFIGCPFSNPWVFFHSPGAGRPLFFFFFLHNNSFAETFFFWTTVIHIGELKISYLPKKKKKLPDLPFFSMLPIGHFLTLILVQNGGPQGGGSTFFLLKHVIFSAPFSSEHPSLACVGGGCSGHTIAYPSLCPSIGLVHQHVDSNGC